MCVWNIVQALERKRITYKNLKNCYCVTKCIFKGNQPFDPGNLSPNKLHSSENWNTKRSFFVILGWGRASENIANCKGKGYTSQEKVKNEFTKTLTANIWLLSSLWLVCTLDLNDSPHLSLDRTVLYLLATLTYIVHSDCVVDLIIIF